MAKTLEQITVENLGGLSFMLCQKEAEISLLQEQLAELKAELAKLQPKEPEAHGS